MLVFGTQPAMPVTTRLDAIDGFIEENYVTSLLRPCWNFPQGLEIVSDMTQRSHGYVFLTFFFFVPSGLILVLCLSSF